MLKQIVLVGLILVSAMSVDEIFLGDVLSSTDPNAVTKWETWDSNFTMYDSYFNNETKIYINTEGTPNNRLWIETEAGGITFISGQSGVTSIYTLASGRSGDWINGDSQIHMLSSNGTSPHIYSSFITNYFDENKFVIDTDGEIVLDPDLTLNVTENAYFDKNVTATYFIGDGSQLTNISGGNGDYVEKWEDWDSVLNITEGNEINLLGINGNMRIARESVGKIEVYGNTLEYSSSGTHKFSKIGLAFDAPLEDWGYRTQVYINDTSDTDPVDYPVNLTLDTETLVNDGKLQNDCEDLRCVQDGEIVDMYISNCDSANTLVMCRFDLNGSNPTDDTYLYYGNPGASGIDKSFNEVFYWLYEDFDDDTGWTCNVSSVFSSADNLDGTCSVSGGTAKVYSPSQMETYSYTGEQFYFKNFEVEYRAVMGSGRWGKLGVSPTYQDDPKYGATGFTLWKISSSPYGRHIIYNRTSVVQQGGMGLGDWPWDNWHTMRYYVHKSTLKSYVDESNETTNTIPEWNGAYLNLALFKTSEVGGVGSVEFDWVRLRPYLEDAPTFTFGNEITPDYIPITIELWSTGTYAYFQHNITDLIVGTTTGDIYMSNNVIIEEDLVVLGNITGGSPAKFSDGIISYDNVDVDKNVTANYFIGDGSQLQNLPGAGGGEKTITLPCNGGYLGSASAGEPYGGLSYEPYYTDLVAGVTGFKYFYSPTHAIPVGSTIKSISFRYQCSSVTMRTDFLGQEEPYNQDPMLGNIALTCDDTLRTYTNSSVNKEILSGYNYYGYVFCNSNNVADKCHCYRWEITYEE